MSEVEGREQAEPVRRTEPARTPVDESNWPRKVAPRTSLAMAALPAANMVLMLLVWLGVEPAAWFLVTFTVVAGLTIGVMGGVLFWSLSSASVRTARIVGVSAGLLAVVVCAVAFARLV